MPVAWELAGIARMHWAAFVLCVALMLATYALLGTGLMRRALPLPLGLIGGIGAALFAGIAPVAPFLAFLPGDVPPFGLLLDAAARATIAGLGAGIAITGVAHLFRRVGKSLERSVNEGSRAAQDGWMLALLLWVLAALYVIFRHDSDWSEMGSSDPLLFVFIGIGTLGAIGSATSAALAQLELNGRRRWLLEIAAQKEQRFRIATTIDLPPDTNLPAINAPADECNAILLEEEGEADQPYRTAPRAVALLRTNDPLRDPRREATA